MINFKEIDVKGTEVSVVILNYNGEKFVSETIEAAEKQTLKPGEIIVVDNGSSDESLEVLRKLQNRIRLEVSEENIFFCKGSNLGLSLASSEFVLLLNNDCVLDPGYLEEAVKPMLADPHVGATTGRIRRVEGNTLDCAGQELARSRKPLDRGYSEPDDSRYSEAEQVFSPGGVAPLLRRTMLDDIAMDGQIFDEDFVQYYEDLDLFWRAYNLGWKCWYNPLATAMHYRGATGQSEPAVQSWVNKFAFANLPENLQVHLLKNRYAVMRKNDSLSAWLLNLPWILAYELKVFAYMLLIKPALFPKYFKSFSFLKIAGRKRKILKRMSHEKGILKYGKPSLK